MNNTTIYSRLIALLAVLLLAVPLTAFAQALPPVVCYVKTTANGGSSSNHGTGWTDALNNLQEAIDKVYNQVKTDGTKAGAPGYVYVAGYDAREEILHPGAIVGERNMGTYYPSSSLYPGETSRQTYSFLMREGVTVYCGFEGNGNDPTKKIGTVTVPDPDKRIRIYLDKEGHETSNIDGATWHMRYQTILSGNYQKQLNPYATEGVDTKFTWNETKQKFDTEFPGNTSHVVTFATNGFYVSTTPTGNDTQVAANSPLIGHAKPLTKKSCLDGAVIENGNAVNNSLDDNHPENAYGGGIYMVPNAETMGCEVRYCAASRDGGGVYMDGGGRNEHLYVHHCQTLGIGIQHGYGGGVAVNNSGLVLHSFLINNVSRMGGGLSMKHDDDYAKAASAAYATGGTMVTGSTTDYYIEKIKNDYGTEVEINPNEKYSAFCAATLIANNTATTEAGGAYLINGTGMNATTVARNRCNGSGARIDGFFTGTTGGIFAIGPVRIYNSLLWGSSVGAYAVGDDDVATAGATDDTDDLQFSAFYDGDPENKSGLYYVALNNSDYVNWSYSITSNILALANGNGGDDHNLQYATLLKPSHVTGYDPSIDYLADYNYQPSFTSSLVTRGVLLNDIGDTDGNDNVSLGEIQTDIFDASISPRCDLGAYVAADLPITFRMMPDVEEVEKLAPGADISTVPLIPTIFVDPNRHSGDANDNDAHGHSWEHPIAQLRNANNFFQEGQDLANDKHFKGTYTYYPTPEATAPITGSVDAPKVQILMKEGTVYTVSTHTHARLRATSVFLIDNCAIYGGYYHGLKNTDLSTIMDGTLNTPVGRNPLIYRSVISGAAAGGAYDTNVARLVQVEGVSNTILDGVELRDANAAILPAGATASTNPVALGNAEALQYGETETASGVTPAFPLPELTASQGAAIYIRNDLRHDEIDDTNMYKVVKHDEGLDMKNIQFRNCIIVGNTAEQGAAVYAYGKPVSGNDAGGLDVKFINCIFHNNSVKRYGTVPETGTKDAGPGSEDAKAADGCGIIYASGAKLTLNINHCDFLRNVGNPIVIDANATVRLNNSILYANLCQEVENTNDHDHYVMKSVVDASGNLVNGTRLTDSHNNFFDKGANNINADLSAYGTVNLTYTYPDESYTYPRFENPTKRSGVTSGGDITYYGYATSFMPMSMNPLTNAANDYGSVKKDITSVVPRTYGGAPDCGAVENNVHQQAGDAVMYVRDYSYTTDSEGKHYSGTPNIDTYDYDGASNYTVNTSGLGIYIKEGSTYHLLDGSSWRYAINGNAEYKKDSHNNAVYGLQYAVNTQSAKTAPASKEDNYQVWVGAGVYKAANYRLSNTLNNGVPETNDYLDEDNSCFIIRDHVNVYGSFPKIGNPAMDERHPLLSQYVKAESATDNYHDFETILEPRDQEKKNYQISRVLGQRYRSNPQRDKIKDGSTYNAARDAFMGCEWDGFTIHHGVLDAQMLMTPKRNGGAGIVFYENVTMRNMVVADNHLFFYKIGTDEFRGGGIFTMGGTLENVYIINNEMKDWNYDTNKPNGSVAAYGGGAYLRDGCTMYNCVAYGNKINAKYADGAGLFLHGIGNFFNNTVVNNEATGTTNCIGGLSVWQDAGVAILNLYNCIIYGNKNTTNKLDSKTIGDANVGIRSGGSINIYNSLVETKATKLGSGSKKIYYDASVQVETNADKIFVDLRNNDTFDKLDLRLKSPNSIVGGENPAINTGLDAPEINSVIYDLSGYTDMDYAERIQDCRIDMGAFEYNGAMDINPELRNDSDPNADPIIFDTQTDAELAGHTAYFYVSENGRGNTRATNPANAACWKKIQKVLDSAGRYKFTHPGLRVVVKLAGTAENMDNETDESRIFKYSPRRSAVPENKDSREYSLLVPRGVEVWGGYYATNNTVKRTDAKPADDQFANDFRDVDRSIIEHQTFLDGNYDTPSIKDLVAYHVLTFTDQVFDVNGIALTTKDLNAAFGLAADYDGVYTFNKGIINGKHVRDVISKYVPLSTGTENVTFASMEKQIASVANNQYTKAIVDGIFVTGGEATGSSSSVGNHNAYGGGAVVTDFAHIRNSIFMNNKAAEGGGALYLQPGALVSGTLLKQNTAAYGGALYFQTWTEDELKAILRKKGDYNGGTWNPYAPTIAKATAAAMASVVTSTIVDNTATRSGGGVWFFDNARFNSSVLWGNHCGNMKNVTGQYSAHLGSDDTIDGLTTLEAYPFSFSAVENLRVPGVNNIQVSPQNSQGVRFTMRSNDFYDGGEKENNQDNIDPYYEPTLFSDLVNTGMSAALYDQKKKDYDYTSADFTEVSRTKDGYTKITIGARAQFAPNEGPLLTRLFVAKSEDVDRVAQLEMQNISTENTDAFSRIYRQQGSSFAYPFKDLEDALAYIREHRKPGSLSALTPYHNSIQTSYNAVNTDFEIIMAGGTYWPTAGINPTDEYALGYTFLIPEGVKIIGGFDCKALTEAFVKNNGLTGKDSDLGKFLGQPEGTLNPSDLADKNIAEWDYKEMMLPRWHYDNNANDIVEPWEFTNRTILSGLTVNASDYFNNYHVCTVIADPTYVGTLPTPTETNSNYVETTTDPKYGTMSKYTGHPIELNGIEITEGDAWDYAYGSAGSLKVKDGLASKYQLYSYYSGGGLVVDGNWYYHNATQTDVTNGLATKLNDPVSDYMHTGVPNAVAYRDIPVEFNKCQLINNKAGYGGAVSTNGTVRFYNSMLASNLAYSGIDDDVDDMVATTENPGKVVSYPGCGGAVYLTKSIVAINTMFQNNEAVDEDPQSDGKTLATGDTYTEPRTFHTLRSSDVIFPGAGACIYAGKNSDYIHVLNCDFVRNKANIYPAVFTANHNPRNVILNSVFWGNLGTYEGSQTNIPIGKDGSSIVYQKGEDNEKIALQPNSIYNSVSSTGYDRNNYVWFSAYEEGRGPLAELKKDLRTMPFRIYTDTERSELDGSLGREVVSFDRIAAEGQNSNIIISSDNNALDGPNFGNPSHNPGIEGFAQDADFMPVRVNRLSDAGWGWIRQNSDNTGFDNTELTPANFDTGTKVDGKIVHDPNDITKNRGGAYSYISTYNGANTAKQPFRNTTYMLLNEAMGGDATMLRIAVMPPPIIGEQIAYIDLGVYEHKNEALIDKGGKHVHEIWVAPHEKLENGVADGSDWLHPTSDLQRAINTLLSNRCGCDRDKVIHLIEGEYAPLNYDSQHNYGFEINTGGLNTSANIVYDEVDGTPFLRSSYESSFVKSLIFDGGYSNSITTMVNGKQQGIRNYEKFPVVITTAQANGTAHHLFNITDARQWYGCGPAQQVEEYSHVNTQSLLHPSNVPSADHYKPTVIPLNFEGITFENGYATGRPASPTEADKAIGTGLGAAIYYPSPHYYLTSEGTIAYIDDKRSGNPLPCEAPSKQFNCSSITDAGNPYKLNIAQCIFRLNGMEAKDAEAGKTPASALYVGAGGGSAVAYSSLFHNNYGAPVNGTDIKLINNTIALNDAKVDLTGPVSSPVSSGITATPANSALIGNIFWRNGGNKANDATISYANEYYVPSGIKITHNAITGANSTDVPTVVTDYVDSNAALTADNKTEDDTDEAKNRCPAFDTDFGPGSEQINPETTDKALIRTFDFHIPVPKVNLIGDMVAADVFYNAVFGTNLTPEQAKAKMVLAGAVVRDLGYGLRLIGNNLERGAYENQTIFHRVLFCNPALSNWAVSDDNTDANHGRIWAFAYPDRTTADAGTLQDAIDLAYMYFLANGANEQSEAYVFVKESDKDGSGNPRILDAIKVPDGVRVIGSIPVGFNEPCGILTEANVSAHPDYEPSNADIAAFITKVEQTRPGLLAPTGATRTLLKGATSTGSYHYGAVLDGVEITDYSSDDDNDPSTPAVYHHGTLTVAPSGTGANPFVLRNAYVHDTNVSIAGTLLYNVFMDENWTGAGDQHVPDADPNTVFAVNVTSSQPLAGGVVMGGASRFNIQNIDQAEFREGIPDNEGYLRYQLDNNKIYDLDQYADIDELCDYYNHTDIVRTMLKRYINPQTDRDLLGNPRLLNGKVDAGCFETWYLSDNHTVTATFQPENVIVGIPGERVWEYYPHRGSMVYLTGNSKLMLNANTLIGIKEADLKQCKDVMPVDYNLAETKDAVNFYDYTFSPYFFLLEEGSSLYGQGVPVKMDYAALKRRIEEGGSIVSLPFPITHDELTVDPLSTTLVSGGIAAGDTDDVPHLSTIKYYDGSARSAYNYDLKDTNSPCWKDYTSGTSFTDKAGTIDMKKSVDHYYSYDIEVIDGVIPANHGFYVNGDSRTDGLGNGDRVHTFVAGSHGSGKDIYTEEKNAPSKDVRIIQYETTTTTQTSVPGGSADRGDGYPYFTTKEDMGWNCIGLPWFISDYKTYERVDAKGTTIVPGDPYYAASPYRMNTPHTLWLYYNGSIKKDELVFDGNGVPVFGGTAAEYNADLTAAGYYSVPSWENTDDLSEYNPWHVTDQDAMRIWVGEGMFTQTATLSSSETVTFYAPIFVNNLLTDGADDGGGNVIVDKPAYPSSTASGYPSAFPSGIASGYPSAFPSGTALGRPARYRVIDGIEEQHPDTPAAAEYLGTDYYTTSGARLSAPLPHGITILRHRYSDGTTRTEKVYRQ